MKGREDSWKVRLPLNEGHEQSTSALVSSHGLVDIPVCARQNEELAGVQQQWEGWSLEVEQLVFREATQGSHASKELGDIKQVL